MGDILKHHKLFTNWWTWIGVKLQQERGYNNVMDWMTALSHNPYVFFDDTGLIEVTDFQKGKSSTAKVNMIRFGDITEISTIAFDYIFNTLRADEIEITIPMTRVVIEDVIQKIPKNLYLESLEAIKQATKQETKQESKTVPIIEEKEEKQNEQPDTKQVSELPRVSESDGSSKLQFQRKKSRKSKQPVTV